MAADATRMTQTYPKRLIEVDLPIARISAHARREKSIRHGHISTLHIWWARRPLAACRAVICAALWPDPADPLCPPAFREAAAAQLMAFAKRVYPERITEESRRLQATASQESSARWEVLAKGDPPLDPADEAHQNVLRFALLDFIADFANWDHSTVPAYLDTARALTQAAHEALGGVPGTRPLVVDPFAGGGSIPLEALRVGADAFASDLNPVAVLLNKVVLEYIPKYGQRLADEVRKWGAWVKEQAEKELAEFYPKDPDGATPIAYLWARTILSEAPGEGPPVEVPLMRSLWLCKKPNRKIALRWVRDKKGQVQTETVEVVYADGTTRAVRRPLLEVFRPEKESDVEGGTVARGSATCPVTGYTTPVKGVRAQLKARRGGAADARLFVVVTTRSTETGRFYRLPTDADRAAVDQAAAALADRTRDPLPNGLTQVPFELTPKGGGRGAGRAFSQRNYGIDRFADLFTPRQLLALTTLSRLIREAGEQLRRRQDVGLAEAVQSSLTLALGKQTDLSNACCAWEPVAECPRHLFGRQAISMVWDWAEGVVSGDSSGAWGIQVDRAEHVLHEIGSDWRQGETARADATASPLPDDAAIAVVTDPPYYDAVPYSDLSDFFYVWMKRTLPAELQRAFADELTPKDAECIVDDAKGKDAAFFERKMTVAMAEGRRVTRPDGVGVVVFAHKSTAGWETQLKAMIDAGWIVTGSWPIDTEMGSRLRAMDSAALASSVHLVCRPREDEAGEVTEAVGEWRDVLAELPRRIREWMPRLAAEGVVGADAIFACLGPALEIFSRYSRVEKASGEAATLREYLEHVWAAVSTEALSMIFKDADAAGLEPDARLTAMWLWTLGGGAGSPGSGAGEDSDGDDGEPVEDEEETPKANGKAAGGYVLEFDAARKIAQGLGIHLEKSERIVEVKGDKARLLPVAERTRHLFGTPDAAAAIPKGRAKKRQKQGSLFEELAAADGIGGDGASADRAELKSPPPGATVLDRVHQAMILFAAGRGEALRRFLVEDAAGADARFWKLAQSLSALYPTGTDEKRWVDGVLARKKGLGL
ncbi:MAG TPA: DUF1156 domain-containing protein [Planctomycetaceae bacterium]